MIKPTELRLGNYVHFLEPRIKGKISGIHHSPIDSIYMVDVDRHYKYPLHLINPIVITDDWLLNFGFKHEESKFYKGTIGLQNTSMPIIKGMEDVNYWAVVQFDPVDGQGYISQNIRLKYVHTLQNLIYALTGEELVLKENATP